MVRAWFSSSEQPALLDDWAVYDAHHDEVNAATLAAAELHPIFAVMSEEARREQNLESHARLRLAFVDGAWAQSEDSPRDRGAAYGAMGIGFADWHEIIRPYVAVLVPHLVAAHGVRKGTGTPQMLAELERHLPARLAIAAEEA